MDDFDLDLGSIEEELDEETESGELILGILDGTTPPEDWIERIARGQSLILAIEGELNELASGFAEEIKEGGGSLIHFRDVLIVTPPGIEVDMSRL